MRSFHGSVFDHALIDMAGMLPCNCDSQAAENELNVIPPRQIVDIELAVVVPDQNTLLELVAALVSVILPRQAPPQLELTILHLPDLRHDQLVRSRYRGRFRHEAGFEIKEHRLSQVKLQLTVAWHVVFRRDGGPLIL
jgi:hypothetical protein